MDFIVETAWYNFRTEEWEYKSDIIDYEDYIPQNNPAQSLYQLYQEHKSLNPAEAALKVLKNYIGIDNE